MTRAAPKLVSAILVVLALVGVCVGLVIARAAGGSIGVSDVLDVLGALGTVLVGALIVWSGRGGAIGWLFEIIGLLLATGVATDDYKEYLARTDGSPIVAVAWVSEWFFVPTFFFLLVLWPMLFPDGLLTGRLWRMLFVGAVSTCAAASVLAALDPVLDWEDVYKIANPIGINGLGDAESGVTGAIVVPLLVFFVLASAASLVVRFRRTRGEARQQIKWIALAGLLLMATILVIAPVFEVITGSNPQWLYALAFLLVPVSVGLAILRHGLFDVDLVIRRTAVYGALTLVLGGAYAGLVLLGQSLSSTLVGSGNLAIAASTLVVAALFLPVRSRVQRFVDRRFYRRRYDAQRTLEGFGARLREQVELPALERDLQAVVTETMQPAHASVWLRKARS